MNAVIALCHFCEAHGPCSIFCTQTLRDTKIENVSFDPLVSSISCVACTSTGMKTALLSHDADSNANFVSTQIPVFPEVATLIRQASVRSLSCEISSNKDGGFVFFGDASRGHVLSHTFHISDVQARGFYQLFSIIILMKDKYFLLNIQPFLSDSLKKISKELQNYAQKVYEEEQFKTCAREQRLSGNQSISQTPRSLIELTAQENIFAILHSHFTWILLAGSRVLTEQIAINHLPWLSVNIKDALHLSKESGNKDQNVETENQAENTYFLRHIKEILGNSFSSACYCILVGIKVIIRGPLEKCNAMALCLITLLPKEMYSVLKLNCPDELNDSHTKIITVPSEVAVPLPNATIFRIDLLETNDKNISVKWPADLPDKSPTLLQKVIKAVDEPLFNDTVLQKHINVLKEEWKNKIICVSRSKSSNDLKLKRVLGIQTQDMPVVSYWIPYVQS